MKRLHSVYLLIFFILLTHPYYSQAFSSSCMNQVLEVVSEPSREGFSREQHLEVNRNLIDIALGFRDLSSDCANFYKKELPKFKETLTSVQKLQHSLPIWGETLKWNDLYEYHKLYPSKDVYYPSIEQLIDWRILSSQTAPEDLKECWYGPYISSNLSDKYKDIDPSDLNEALSCAL